MTTALQRMTTAATPATAPTMPTAPTTPAVAHATPSASWSPSPAPDGRRIALVSDRSGSPRGYVHDADPTAPPPLPLPTGPEPVLRVTWSPDGAWIACVIAPGGAPRTEIWVIRPDGSDLRQISGYGDTTALLGEWLPGADARLAVTESDETSRAVVVDVPTGQRRALVTDDLLVLLDVSADGSRALLRCGTRGRRWVEVLDVASGDRRRLWPDTGRGSTEVAWFAADGHRAYALTDAYAELAALVVVDLPVAGEPGPVVAGEPAVLAWRADAELEAVTLTADRCAAALLWNRYGGVSELGLLDLATGVGRPVPAAGGEVLDGCAFSADGSVLGVTAQGPAYPRAVWLVDPTSGAGRPLTGPPGGGTPAATVAPQLCELPAGDGLTISGWLYRPAGDGPWPTVISLHGGPEAQERPGYRPLLQALVARGLAVFAPNVRGSTGFGRSYVEADNLAGRYGAIADVRACVDYLVDAGIAEPGRIGCMGRSYGGYLTLAVLVAFPELFAAGVSECGMSDFATFYRDTEPWIAAAAVGKYGHPEQDRDLLYDLSPLHRIDRLTAPLLLIHGANDRNVPVGESAQVVAALQERGRTHGYLLLPGEGHDFLSAENRQAAIEATGGWLAGHLAGPPDDL